jgi:hypothetical protein
VMAVSMPTRYYSTPAYPPVPVELALSRTVSDVLTELQIWNGI